MKKLILIAILLFISSSVFAQDIFGPPNYFYKQNDSIFVRSGLVFGSASSSTDTSLLTHKSAFSQSITATGGDMNFTTAGIGYFTSPSNLILTGSTGYMNLSSSPEIFGNQLTIRNNNNYTRIRFARYNGTVGNYTPVLNTQILSKLDATGTLDGSPSGGLGLTTGIRSYAAADFTSTSSPGYLTFETTPIGAVDLKIAAIVTENQTFQVAPSAELSKSKFLVRGSATEKIASFLDTLGAERLYINQRGNLVSTDSLTANNLLADSLITNYVSSTGNIYGANFGVGTKIPFFKMSIEADTALVVRSPLFGGTQYNDVRDSSSFWITFNHWTGSVNVGLKGKTGNTILLVDSVNWSITNTNITLNGLVTGNSNSFWNGRGSFGNSNGQSGTQLYTAGTLFTSSGSSRGINTDVSFTPSTGTATFAGLEWSGTIAQTGGANGITRGLYLNPTITTAADFRAIEVTTGKSLFQDIVSNSSTKGLVLFDGSHYWRFTVNGSGVLSSGVDLGTSLTGF